MNKRITKRYSQTKKKAIVGKNTITTRQTGVDIGTRHNMTQQGGPLGYGHTQTKTYDEQKKREAIPKGGQQGGSNPSGQTPDEGVEIRAVEIPSD